MRILANLRSWRSYHRTVDELQRMTSRELRDLGISPSEILQIAKGQRPRD